MKSENVILISIRLQILLRHSAGNSVKIKSVNGSPEPKVKLTSKIGKCDLDRDRLVLTNLQILLRHSVGNSVNGRRLNLFLASEHIDK